MEQPLSRSRPERTAWAVVWSSFALFCLLVVFVPLGARHFVLHATVARPATLQTVEGTAVSDSPATGNEAAVTKDQTATISEGFVVSLDDKSRADLRFFDGSFVHLLPGSRVALERSSGPRFGSGISPNAIWLRMLSGRIRVVTAGSSQRTGLDFRVRCPLQDAEILISDDGVYGVEVQPGGAEVFVNRGSAVVSAQGKSVRLTAPERTIIEPGRAPADAITDARELVVNGDFRSGLEPAWVVRNDQGNDGGDVDGTAVVTTDEGSPAVRFFRTDSNRNHCETIIEQRMDRDLPDPISSLVIRANIKLVNQSLSGGGALGSEYPLMIRMRYRDQYGNENEWVQGFYYENPLANPVGNARLYPRGAWQLFESGNLLAVLDPRPARIVWLQVYASGWDYESMVRSISVAVQ
ncbi:MAG: FecR family protein [Anaerolineae bacterium]|nr:FecR family protein [Anaerolineae bacterium]